MAVMHDGSHVRSRRFTLGIAAAYLILIIISFYLTADLVVYPWNVRPAEQAASSPDPKYTTGKIVIVGSAGCQYGEFDNLAPSSFTLVPSPCTRALNQLESTGVLEAKTGSRIRAIGEYFRSGH
jgi:hypothetical protein